MNPRLPIPPPVPRRMPISRVANADASDAVGFSARLRAARMLLPALLCAASATAAGDFTRGVGVLRPQPLAGHAPPARFPGGRVVEIGYRQAPQVAELFEQTLLSLPVDSWWEDWMRHADRLLDDPELVDIVYQALLKRWPKSRTRGRLSTPAEVVL